MISCATRRRVEALASTVSRLRVDFTTLLFPNLKADTNRQADRHSGPASHPPVPAAGRPPRALAGVPGAVTGSPGRTSRAHRRGGRRAEPRKPAHRPRGRRTPHRTRPAGAPRRRTHGERGRLLHGGVRRCRVRPESSGPSRDRDPHRAHVPGRPARGQRRRTRRPRAGQRGAPAGRNRVLGCLYPLPELTLSPAWVLDFRSPLPLHPGRLRQLAPFLSRGPRRSRGCSWLPSRPRQACLWAGAGGRLGVGVERTWRSDEPLTRIVVVGVDEGRGQLESALRSCLLTEDDVATGGTVWEVSSDGLEPWLGPVRQGP
ncbi:MAG: GTP-binding protein [Propionibacteriaceae bacterium]|nr:GTP-binding protein [Propionibacteriaceae bacterium]